MCWNPTQHIVVFVLIGCIGASMVASVLKAIPWLATVAVNRCGSLSILVAVRQRWKRRCKGWRQRTSFASRFSHELHELGSFKLGHLLGCHEACWAGWEMWEIHGNLASARHFCFSVMELLICAPFISILLHAQIIRCLQVKERTTPLTSPFVQLAQYFRSVHNHVITYSSTFFCKPFLLLRPTALPAQWSIMIRVE